MPRCRPLTFSHVGEKALLEKGHEKWTYQIIQVPALMLFGRAQTHYRNPDLVDHIS